MPLFTRENARTMAVRGHQLRKQRLEELRIAANPVPLPADNSYVERRLARVRQQIENLSDMLESEKEPAKLDRLASCLARLSEIERQLANRPLPGSRRPAPDRSRNHFVPLPPPVPE
jgi:hypothetical protein